MQKATCLVVHGSGQDQRAQHRRGRTPHANKFSIFTGNSRPRTPVAWWSADAELADPACAKFVHLFVGEVDETDVDGRHVGVYHHHVVGQITVDRRAVLRIVSGVLQQCHADSHHDRAHDLVPAGQWVDNAARINNWHNAADAQPRDFRLPGNLDEVTSERVRRELRLGIADCRFGFAAARDQAKVGAEQQIIERHTFSSAISLHKGPTALECQIFGRAVLERRARIVAMVKRYCWDFCTGADLEH